MRRLTVRDLTPVRPRASRAEILGAWMGVWTPPRDVPIPPRPSPRRLAAVAALVLLIVGVGLALAAPRIDEAKDERAARALAEQAARDAARRAGAVRIQRAAFGTSAAGTPGAQLADARTAILAGARARHAAGELDRRPRAVRCARAAGRARADLQRFSCLAVTDPVAGLAGGPRRNIGYPFSLVLQPETGRFAWCRTLPVPAEGATGSGVRVAQPAACRGATAPVP